MAPVLPAGSAPSLAAFLTHLRDKEHNAVDSCIELLIS